MVFFVGGGEGGVVGAGGRGTGPLPGLELRANRLGLLTSKS